MFYTKNSPIQHPNISVYNSFEFSTLQKFEILQESAKNNP